MKIEVEVHHYFHDDPITSAAMQTLLERTAHMEQALQELAAEVDGLTTVIESADALIGSLADKVDAVAGNATKTRALAAQLRQEKSSLATAVAAHTQAQDEPVPDPAPTPAPAPTPTTDGPPDTTPAV